MQSKFTTKPAHRLNKFLTQKVDELLCATSDGSDRPEWADPSSLVKTALSFSAKARHNEPTAAPLAHRFCRLISVHKTLYESYDPNWKKCGARPIRDEVTWRYVVAGLLSLTLKQAHDTPTQAFKFLNAAFYTLEAWGRDFPQSEIQKELQALADEVFEEVMP